ncbi:unnamed protein product [Gordionus sp. m RMFG-2023]|uniref:nitric oxide synthase-interacting protein-like n=1 Tax=Gordionus sp. m RMFG-2023 TaxID=3053472 RepID=UPI0030DDF1FD
MTRHSRNCTSNPVYSYHEQKKDSVSGNYGTQRLRCGKESIKDFDCCSLSLQPCIDPVVTPDGYLFDKAAIIEFILTKKKEIKNQKIDYEKYKEEKEKNSVENLNKEAKRQKFIKREDDILTQSTLVSKSMAPIISNREFITPLSSQLLNKVKVANPEQDNRNNISNNSQSNDNKTTLFSFWVPSLTPDASAKRNSKGELIVDLEHSKSNNINFNHKEPPKTQVLCPFSGKLLRMKDLIPVKFKKVAKDGKSNGDPTHYTANSSKYHYVCAVTGDIISNSIPCAVLRPSGCVVTLQCVEKIIKNDMIDPINGIKLRKYDLDFPEIDKNDSDKDGNFGNFEYLKHLSPDIIFLERGGTGFSQACQDTELLKSRVKRPVLHM